MYYYYFEDKYRKGNQGTGGSCFIELLGKSLLFSEMTRIGGSIVCRITKSTDLTFTYPY